MTFEVLTELLWLILRFYHEVTILWQMNWFDIPTRWTWMKHGIPMFISTHIITTKIKIRIRDRNINNHQGVNIRRKQYSSNGKCHSGVNAIFCVMVNNFERLLVYRSIQDVMSHRHRVANQNQKMNTKPAMLDVSLSQYFYYSFF